MTERDEQHFHWQHFGQSDHFGNSNISTDDDRKCYLTKPTNLVHFYHLEDYINKAKTDLVTNIAAS